MIWNEDGPTCHEQELKMISAPDVWRPPMTSITEFSANITEWRTCSYCGSIHPADLVELTKKYEFVGHSGDWEERAKHNRMSMADRKYGYPHKVYVHLNAVLHPEMDVPCGSDVDNKPIMRKGYTPFIKFYTQHLHDRGIDQEAFDAIAKVLSTYTGWLPMRVQDLSGQSLLWRMEAT